MVPPGKMSVDIWQNWKTSYFHQMLTLQERGIQMDLEYDWRHLGRNQYIAFLATVWRAAKAAWRATDIRPWLFCYNDNVYRVGSFLCSGVHICQFAFFDHTTFKKQINFIIFSCHNSFSFQLDIWKEITAIVAMYIIKNEELKKIH